MLLRKMRKKVRLIMGLTLLFIIPTFIWWGVGTRSASQKNLIAKVNGYPLTLEDFYQEYNFLYQRYALLYSNLPQEEFQEKIRELNLEEKAFENLVENILLSQEIKRRHIKISDEEMAQAIRTHPVFLTLEGIFDKEKFERARQNLTVTQWQIWQRQIRAQLALEKLKKEIEAQTREEEKKKESFNKWLAEKKSQAKIVQQQLPELTE